MWNIITETLRTCLIGVIFVLIWWLGKKAQLPQQQGWNIFIAGLFCVFLGNVIDLTHAFALAGSNDAFPHRVALLFAADIIGGLIATLLMAIGIWLWTPFITGLQQTKQALETHNADLEAQINTRTAELHDLNDRLWREAEGSRGFEEALRLYKRAIVGTSNGVIISDANKDDLPIIYCNPAFERITGYASDQVIGRNWRFLQGPETDSQTLSELRQAIYAGDECLVVLKNYRQDGTSFWNELSMSPVRDTRGKLTHYVGVLTDITERQHSEERVRKSEELYRTLARNLPKSTVLLFDHALQCIIAEGADLAVYATTQSGLEDKPVKCVLPPEIWEQQEPYYRAALAGSESVFEAVYNDRVTLVTILPVKNEHGAIFAGMVLMQNVTEDRLAKEALRASEQRLQTVIASAPIFLFAFDHKGDFTFLEGKGLDVLQLKAVDNQEHTAFDMYREAPQVLEHKRRALQGEAVTAIEYVADFVFETRYSPLRDQDGVVFSVIGVATDITERERAKEEFQLQRDFALQIMGTMGQGLAVTDATHHFEFVNPAYAHMLGCAPEDLIGTSFFDAIVFEDRESLIQAVQHRTPGEATTCEIRLYSANGDIIYALINDVHRVYNQRVVGSIIVVTDLTERKRIEEQRAIVRDQALEASRLKSEFLAMMSHEIRTPMNAIIGMTELLIDTSLNAEQREYTSIVRDSGQALLTIIDDILDFSKIEAGKIVLETVDFNLVEVVEGTAELLASQARDKGLSLMTFVEPGVPAILRGDPGRLRQILLNLTSNAVKFTEAGEVVVRVMIEQQYETHVVLRFTVTDTGIGLSSVAQQRLFQPFTQADGSTNRKYGGTGLGLVISKRLTELMRGQMGVDSVEGQGAQFWFTACFEGVNAPPTKSNLRELHVLVVDDSQTRQGIIQSHLFAWGIRSDTAANGGEALTNLRRAASTHDPYDIVIIDASLPDMDGFALARAIKRDLIIAQTKLVLLTNFNEREKRAKDREGSFAAYLTKPVKQSQLFNTITGIVNETQTHLSGSSTPPKQPSVSDTASSPSLPAQPYAPILLVEDYAPNQRLALRQLEKLGYTAQAVSNGREAVDAVERDPEAYALILMDCQTPEMDGFEATRRIRAMEMAREPTGHIPIIAMTANAMQGDREACLAAGMDDYISKPVSQRALHRAIKQWLKPAEPYSAAKLDNAGDSVSLLDNVVLSGLRELQEAGETNFLSDLVDIYFNDAPEFITTMRTAIDTGDSNTLKRAVHTFKGSSANIGAKTVAALCKELERKSRTDDMQSLSIVLAQIEAEYERVKPLLDAERNAGTG